MMFQHIVKELLFNKRDSVSPLDDLLDQYDNKILESGEAFLSDGSSRKRHLFNADRMFERLTTGQRLSMFPLMYSLYREFMRSVTSAGKKHIYGKTSIDASSISGLEERAKHHGVSDISYTSVPSSYIFKDKGIPFTNAIVVTKEMDKGLIDKAPSYETMIMVIDTYKELNHIVNALAAFLRRRGHGAVAGPALGCTVIYPRLAERAGLGSMGKHGMLISPGYGPRQRIAAVFTSINNLPIVEHNPHLWIRDYCQICHRCTTECPVKAIYNNPPHDQNGFMSCVDGDACMEYFGTHFGCSICIKECPFSNRSYEFLKRLR